MREPGPESEAVILQELLGYLNFSSGASDPQFLANLDRLYRRIEADGPQQADTWQRVRDELQGRLDELAGTSAAFRDSEQARAVIALVFDHFSPAYREFHRDLLPRQSDAALWRPFFLGRVCEAVLRQGAPWDDADRVISQARSEVDDFLGHRPVAVLRSAQRIEPYAHEWVRPLPLYIRSVGVATGRYERLLEPDARYFAGDRCGHQTRSLVRSRPARRAGRRSARVRFRSSGQQASELSFWPVGSAPHRPSRPLPPVRAATGHARCAAGPRRGIAANFRRTSCCSRRPGFWPARF